MVKIDTKYNPLDIETVNNIYSQVSVLIDTNKFIGMFVYFNGVVEIQRETKYNSGANICFGSKDSIFYIKDTLVKNGYLDNTYSMIPAVFIDTEDINNIIKDCLYRKKILEELQKYLNTKIQELLTLQKLNNLEYKEIKSMEYDSMYNLLSSNEKKAFEDMMKQTKELKHLELMRVLNLAKFDKNDLLTDIIIRRTEEYKNINIGGN